MFELKKSLKKRWKIKWKEKKLYDSGVDSEDKPTILSTRIQTKCLASKFVDLSADIIIIIISIGITTYLF